VNAARVALQLVRADFLERVRTHGFLVTLGFTLIAGYLFLPPNHARYATLHFAGHRGVYNSAWVGAVIAMLSAVFIGLAGYYLVKNAVERDRRTGVGQILAATPLPAPLYLLGKMVSNFAVLAAMVAVLVVAAAVMQLVRGEDPTVRPLALVAPFVTVTLPVMALVAGIAVTFEVVPGLRGGLGNVVYFFLWIAGLSITAPTGGSRWLDPAGLDLVLDQMHAACVAAFPGFPAERGLSMGFNFKSEGVWDLQTFVWSGPTWTPAMLASRASWGVASVLLTLAATVWFDRFRGSAAPAAAVPARGRRPRRGPAPEGGDPADLGPPVRSAVVLPWATGVTDAEARRSRLPALVGAELRIALRGISRWWLLVVLGLQVAGALLPLSAVRGFVAPIALVWPLLCWSAMGSRESRHRTEGLLFSSPRPLARLFAAQWLAGACVALGVVAVPLARLALARDWSGLSALLVSAAFIPSLAMALGTWSGSGRAFEVLYLILWYAGPMSRIPFLDYAGTTQPETGGGPALGFLAASAALVCLALAGRRRQMRR